MKFRYLLLVSLLAVAASAKASDYGWVDKGANAMPEPPQKKLIITEPSAPSASPSESQQTPAMVKNPSIDSPSVAAFEAANHKMHAAMTIDFTGNADADFIRGMIPHHQGAVEMAEIVLKYGKDSKVKNLAKDIIKAQNKEIAWMQKWLADYDKKSTKSSH